MRQAADVAGAPGLTFVLVVANECAWAVLRSAVAAGRLSTKAATHAAGASAGDNKRTRRRRAR